MKTDQINKILASQAKGEEPLEYLTRLHRCAMEAELKGFEHLAESCRTEILQERNRLMAVDGNAAFSR